jgi:23S rRNA (guanine745-N1)-methyltransferase
LAQLKALVYEEVNEHAEEIDLPDGFERLASQRISRWISLEPLERAALLQMTPFAWRATQQTWGALERMEELHIETDFILTLARKIA